MPGHGVIPIRTQAGNQYRPCPAASTKTAGKIHPVGTGLAGPRRPGHPTPHHHLRRSGSAAPQPPPYGPPRPRPHRRLLQRARAPAPGRGLRRPEDGGAQPGQRRRLPAEQEPGTRLQLRLVRPGAPDPRGNQGGPPGPEPEAVHQCQGEGGQNNSLNSRPELTSLGNHPSAQTPEGTNRQNFELSLPLPSPKGRTIGEKRGESDATQLRSSRTSGNNEPLSDVDGDGTESPPRLPGHRVSGGIRGGPAAAGPQPGTAKTVSLSADRLPVETAKPPVSRGTGYVRTLRPSRVPTRLSARRTARSRQTEAPAPKGGRRGLEHGRDRLRRPEQCPASEEPELENRVEALTGPAPRYEFHPRLPL